MHADDLAPDYVVGIGASAGGLDALTTLFTNLPSSANAAFVVVQHLSPSFKSMMDQLLQKQTQMLVSIAQHGVKLQSGHVYLNPPNHDLSIVSGVLHLTKIETRSSLHLPIDHFFISLADDQRHTAIAIILSGTGSDGTRGIARLKEKGGLVIVQDPAEAEFDGMPNSAIRTNLVDVVLPVAEIPTQLASYMHHPFVGEKSQSLFREHLSQKSDFVEKILRKLQEFNGFDFLEYKPSTVARRIERRMGVTNITDIADYYKLIAQDEQEIPTLCQEILIGVTEFFREPEVFDYLAESVLPNIISRKQSDEEIRVWVAACSTGEEAYSLAILFDEVLERMRRSNPVRIFATDVDERAISIAAKGQYPVGALTGISDKRRSGYFRIAGTEYLISPRIRKMVVFAQHNLIKDPPFSNMDLVSCRNMLIYLQNTAQERALSFMHFALQPSGYLILGISETPGNLESYFAVTENRKKIYQKKHDVRIPISRFSTQTQRIAMPDHKGHTWSSMGAIKSSGRQRQRLEFSPSTDFLVRRFAPPTIVVNEESEVVYICGDVHIYTRKLSQGEFRGVLDDILLPEVSVSVSTALYRAKKEKQEIRYSAVSFSTDTGKMNTNVTVAQIDSELANGQLLYAIMFDALQELGQNDALSEANVDLSRDTLMRVQELEDELNENRKQLRITVEELETTNEELQSANEELMAANEELQSTNEELQSVNEELYTVNQEYQEKIHELTTTYNDLNNLLNSTNIAVLFLDEKLHIRRFTKASTAFFNIKSMDVGRPITDFTCEYNLPDFKEQYKKIFLLGNDLTFTISTNDDETANLKILPYHTEDDHIEGMVLMFSKDEELTSTDKKTEGVES